MLSRVDAFGNGTCESSGPCFGKKVADCDDGDPCTNDLCDVAHGGCYHEAFADDAPCSPGKICFQGKCM